jgi:antirestriction protein ArdC|tara:strand:- start:445 stop:702 length:258 start_codon:yes stop_codon:yes gene_type:complete
MINALTNRPYTGQNADILMTSGYEDPRFMTFAQARKMGRKVKKGSKGIGLRRIVEVNKMNTKTGRIERKKAPKYFTVFNWTQTEG